MATGIPSGFSRSPKVFRLSDSWPTPLDSPSTGYLTTIPVIPTSPLASQGQNWQRLDSTANRSDIYVPGPPTPRTPRLRNDTPTPAASTPGSWRGRRRQGQAVDRPHIPPRVRLHPTGNVGSTSSDMPSSGSEYVESPAGETGATSLDTAGSANGGSRRISSYSDTTPLVVDTAVQIPPAAKVAPHRDQHDGAPDEEATMPKRKHKSYCRRVCGSLKSIPSKLHFVTEKIKKGIGKVEDDERYIYTYNTSENRSPARPLAATQKHTNWWYHASLRSRRPKAKTWKPVPGRKFRRSSLSAFLKSMGASGSGAPSDDRHAPQASGAPTNEHDSNSPVEPELFSAETEEAALQERCRVARQIAKGKQRESSFEQVVVDDVVQPVFKMGSWPRRK